MNAEDAPLSLGTALRDGLVEGRRTKSIIGCFYEGRFVAQFQLDRVVDDRVVLEIKSTQRLGKEEPRQLLNYLRATKWEVGLLLHFGPQPAFYRLISTNRDIRKGIESKK